MMGGLSPDVCAPTGWRTGPTPPPIPRGALISISVHTVSPGSRRIRRRSGSRSPNASTRCPPGCRRGDVMKRRQVSGTDARDQAARPAGPAGPAQVTDGPAETRTPQQAVGDRAATAGDPARGGGGAAGGLAVTGYRRRGRGWIAALAVAVVVAAGVAGADAAGLFRGSGSPAPGSGSGYQTGTAAVRRGTLTEQTQQNGTLGNAGSYTVVVPSPSGSGAPSPGSGSGSGSGTFTWLPAVGQTIRQGHVLYRVSGTPVVLLYGRSPAYRSLAQV